MQEIISEKIEQTPKKEKFNFPEIQAIREDMISLCGKMKEAINEGRYNILVSDEVGGRIPTLILRKIIKKIHPEKNLRTLFVASGQTISLPDYTQKDDYKKLIKYLSVSAQDYILLVTQFIYQGKTVQKLASALIDAARGPRGLDIAATTSFHLSEKELKRGIYTEEEAEMDGRGRYPEGDWLPLGADNIYIGGVTQSTKELEKRHNRFAGVAKERSYNPSPIMYTKAMEKYGKDMNFYSDEELKEIFGIEEGDSAEIIYTKKWETPENMKKYEEVRSQPLSDEEKKQIMEDITKAREDVNTMAQAILKEVWGV